MFQWIRFVWSLLLALKKFPDEVIVISSHILSFPFPFSSRRRWMGCRVDWWLTWNCFYHCSWYRVMRSYCCIWCIFFHCSIISMSLAAVVRLCFPSLEFTLAALDVGLFSMLIVQIVWFNTEWIFKLLNIFVWYLYFRKAPKCIS